jgi:adenosine deaminase
VSHDIARASDQTLDIRDLPKVSLHEHLDGGLRPETIIDLAPAAGVQLPTHDPDDLADWFVESARAGSLERYLETFALTLAVMQTARNLTRVAREYVEDLVQDGVVYAEVRWAPEQHQEGGLTLDEAIAAVREGLEQGMDAALADGQDILVTQIITAMRQGERSEEVAMTALRHRDVGVVGFDLAGPEAGFPASGHRAALDLLAEQLFPVTIHAGEGDGLESIRSAIVDGRALRLGHGVRIAEDLEEEVDVDEDGESVEVLSAGPVATWVRDRGIPLEICPSSNLDTRATAAWGDDLASHPFHLLLTAGFVVTVSPDNRLMSDTTLSDELAQLVEVFDYDVEDLLTLTLNAVEGSFLGLDEKQDLAETVVEAYDALLEDADGADSADA